jgi:hypothetical protein
MSLNVKRRSVAECGTYAGWNAHQRLRTEVCQPCYEARKSYVKDWNFKNKEKNKAYRLKWNTSNKEYNRNQCRKRRAIRKNSGWENYSEQQVLDTYGPICHLCKKSIDLIAPRKTGKNGWEKGLHIDHIIPISKGGPDTLGNVRPSHGLCNILRQNNTIGEVMEDFETEIDPLLFEDEGVDLDDLDYDKHALDEEDLDDWEDE